MIITDIRKRRGRLFALFSYDEQVALLDSAVVSENGIRAGCTLSQEELEALTEESENRRAKEKALYLLTYRDHSGRELERKLRRTGSPEAAQNAVEKMREYGLVDDEGFAMRQAQHMTRVKGYASSRVRYELCRKGIDREIAENIIEELDADECDNLRNILERRFLPLPEDEKGMQKCIRSLQRLGYSYEDIRSVLREYKDEV